jgi:amino acid permease
MSSLYLLSILSDNKIEKYLKNEKEDNFSSLLNDNKLIENNENDNNEENNKENNKEILLENEEEYEEENKSIIEPEKRSTFNKIFGKMEAGSIRGSIFNMLILTLGSGLLSLPTYIGKVSIILSSILIIVISILIWWSLLLLSKACEKSGTYNYSYLLKKLYGKKLSLIYDFIVIIYSFGILILYQVIIHKLIGESLYYLFYVNDYKTFEEFEKNSFWNDFIFKYCLPFSLLFIIYPLCLIKDVSKLRFISFFGIMTILSLIFLIIFQSYSYIKFHLNNVYKKEDKNTHYNIFDIKKGFDENLYFFQFCSTIFFACCMHIGAIPIFNTLKNNVRKRMYKVVRRTLLVDIFVFVLIANLGYLSCPINTPALIIERPKLESNKKDFLMCLGRISLVLTLIMKLPNCYATLRLTLFDKLWGTTSITNKKNYVLTFLVVVFCCFVSVVYVKISGYIKLLGGICSTLVGFIFPSLLITRANKRTKWHWKNVATIFIFVLLTLIGFISSGRTIYDIIKGNQ